MTAHSHIYLSTKHDNERHVARINRAWGERVAWLEDRQFDDPERGSLVLPVVVSNLVRGLVPGKTEPRFVCRVGG